MRFTAILISSILTTLLFTSFFQKKSHAEVIDMIVAQVGDKIVTLHDIEVFAPAVVKRIYSMPDGEERRSEWDKYYQDTIDFMIYDVTLQTAAARMGITAGDREINDLIVRLQDENTQFRAQVLSILDREGEVTPELYLYVKQIILSNKVKNALVSRAIVTEQDIREFAKNDPNLSYGKLEYNIKIAFLPDKESYDKIHDFAQRHDFEDSVKASGHSVIDMGWVKHEDLVPLIREAATKINEGEITNVYDESGNIIAIKLENTRESSQISENTRNAIIYALKEQQMDTIFQRWLDRQKQSIIVYRYK